MSGMAPLNRRELLAFSGAALVAPLLPRDALAAVPTGEPLHGISAFGELKYGPDFTHFDYANPEAPNGGTFNFSPPNWVLNQSVLTFNTLNPFVAAGDSPPRMEMCFDALMVSAIDEPDAMYGLLARTVTVSEDRNSFTFEMRPEARFHDGSKLTAEDAAFTYELFGKDGHPSLLLPLTELVEAKAEDEHRLRLTFSGKQSQRTVFAVAGYPIVSRAFFTDNPFDGSQLNAPLGSGRYRVGRYAAGQYIEYDRFEDYWAKDLPVRRGLDHFERLRIEFYRDRQAAFEAFKKGNILYRQEFTSRVWATGYDFPAIKDGRVVKRDFPSELIPSMQAWAINQRRERFRDPRVRRAIAMCFDFEWTNRNLFYGLYERSNSCFERSEFKAEGTPSPAELEIMEPYRDEIPEEAFGEIYVQPSSDGSGRDRKLLRAARQMLVEAGWSPAGNMLQDADGRRLGLELLVQDDTLVRIATPFTQNLRAIGVDATIRMVDPTQYQARQRDFDFDLVMIALSFSATPARDTLANIFHSRAADLPGSRNLPGTRDPVIDALVEQVGAADDREQLANVMRVLDRVLRTRMDWIPNWYSANHRAAFWDMFGFREPKPDYGFPVESLWWQDKEKAQAIGKA